jgi:hypothetical protein
MRVLLSLLGAAVLVALARPAIAGPPFVSDDYDLTKNFHLLGYVRRGVENAEQTDRYSWYTSVLFTF